MKQAKNFLITLTALVVVMIAGVNLCDASIHTDDSATTETLAAAMAVSGITTRYNYNALRQKYARKGKGNVRLSQSTLNLIQNIDANRRDYRFNVLENEAGAALSGEIRLNQNDEFIIESVRVALLARISDTNDPPTDTDPLQTLTYVPYHFEAAFAQLQSLYSGTLSIAVNNIVYLEKWDLERHYKVQLQEYVNNLNIAAGPPSNTSKLPAMIASLDGKLDAHYPLTPSVTLSGAKKNDIEIQLPAAITADVMSLDDQQDPSTTTQLNIKAIGVQLRGFLAQNASAFQ